MKLPSKILCWVPIPVPGLQKVVQTKVTIGIRDSVGKCHLIHDIEHYAQFMYDTG